MMKTRIETALESADDRVPACTYRAVSVAAAVDSVYAGLWDVPPFQRRFAWRPQQACDLADSLWRGYPVGLILLWRPEPHNHDTSRLWIADGQQRLTSLCLLAGAAPPWALAGLNGAGPARTHNFYFDADAVEPPRFIALPAGRRPVRRGRLIDCAELLRIDLATDAGRNQLAHLVTRFKRGRGLDGDDALLGRLTRVCMIRHQALLVAEIECAHAEEVLEAFRRLNCSGMSYRRMLLKLVQGAIGGRRRYAALPGVRPWR